MAFAPEGKLRFRGKGFKADSEHQSFGLRLQSLDAAQH
jgi:hypothetical protein